MFAFKFVFVTKVRCSLESYQHLRDLPEHLKKNVAMACIKATFNKKTYGQMWGASFIVIPVLKAMFAFPISIPWDWYSYLYLHEFMNGGCFLMGISLDR